VLGKLGIFEAVKQFFPALELKEEEGWMRNAAHEVAGPRGRRIFFLKDGFNGDCENVAGITSTSTGNVYIDGSLNPRELHETVRHEIFHSVLTPRSLPLRYAHFIMNNKSPLYIYLREASAQAYGARSLWQGLKYPIKYNYVKPTWLVPEISILGAAGYGAYAALTANPHRPIRRRRRGTNNWSLEGRTKGPYASPGSRARRALILRFRNGRPAEHRLTATAT
jgi:hypothetical protein